MQAAIDSGAMPDRNPSATTTARSRSPTRSPACAVGAVQVQGTINGIGERCGNANLVSIIPDLQLKLGYQCVPPAKLKMLREVSMLVYELANITPHTRQAYVGRSAFAHKGGPARLRYPAQRAHV